MFWDSRENLVVAAEVGKFEISTFFYTIECFCRHYKHYDEYIIHDDKHPLTFTYLARYTYFLT